MIIGGLIGGIIGGLSGKGFTLNLRYFINVNEYLFEIFFGLEGVIAFIIIAYLINLKIKYKFVELQSIPKNVENRIDIILYLSTILTILSLTWMAVAINTGIGDRVTTNVVIVTVAIIISTILKTLSVKIYNKFYPDRKLNMYENNADEKFFNKLDEGEKWIAYSCSYKSFKGMQLAFTVVLTFTLLLSFLVDTPVILPITVAILWIIQISIYTVEAQKYND
jgi:hypothetical protein